MCTLVYYATTSEAFVPFPEAIATGRRLPQQFLLVHRARRGGLRVDFLLDREQLARYFSWQRALRTAQVGFGPVAGSPGQDASPVFSRTLYLERVQRAWGAGKVVFGAGNEASILGARPSGWCTTSKKGSKELEVSLL